MPGRPVAAIVLSWWNGTRGNFQGMFLHRVRIVGGLVTELGDPEPDPGAGPTASLRAEGCPDALAGPWTCS